MSDDASIPDADEDVATHEVSEAIRFAEEYGYNKWQVAAEEHRALVARLATVTRARDEAEKHSKHLELEMQVSDGEVDAAQAEVSRLTRANEEAREALTDILNGETQDAGPSTVAYIAEFLASPTDPGEERCTDPDCDQEALIGPHVHIVPCPGHAALESEDNPEGYCSGIAP